MVIFNYWAVRSRLGTSSKSGERAEAVGRCSGGTSILWSQISLEFLAGSRCILHPGDSLVRLVAEGQFRFGFPPRFHRTGVARLDLEVYAFPGAVLLVSRTSPLSCCICDMLWCTECPALMVPKIRAVWRRMRAEGWAKKRLPAKSFCVGNSPSEVHQ